MKKSPFLKLSLRIQNSLCGNGIHNIEEAMHAVKTGAVIKFRNMGKVSIKQLSHFLGVPIPRSVDPLECKFFSELQECKKEIKWLDNENKQLKEDVRRLRSKL